jgi:hypothetical protein
MVAWTIGIEIKGARADGEGLLRLLAVFDRDVPNFVADRAFSSGRLVVCGTVESESASEALISALATTSDAFDEAGIDEELRSEVTNVTLHRAGEAASAESDWLSAVLLRRIRREVADAHELRDGRAGTGATAA